MGARSNAASCEPESELAEAILDAAGQALRRSNYANLKMQLVARVAGISIGTIYRTFGSQDGLITALVKRDLPRAARGLGAACATGTPTERVQAWLDGVIGRGLDDTRARNRWFMDVARRLELEVATGEAIAVLLEPLRNAIAAGKADGSFPDADVDHDTEFIWYIAGRVVSGSEWDGRSGDEAVAAVASFVLRALQSH